MNHLKIVLKDNDHVIRATADLGINRNEDTFGIFLREMKSELIIGQTAQLEVDSSEMGNMMFEISRIE